LRLIELIIYEALPAQYGRKLSARNQPKPFRREAQAMTAFEIIDGIPLFPERRGRHAKDDSQPMERMKRDLLAGKYKHIIHAAEAACECAQGHSHKSTAKRLATKFSAAIRADVISTWIQYYYLVLCLGIW
jgi:hypothetical protein